MTSKSFHTMSVSHILQTGMARTKRQGWHLNDPSLATGVTGGHPSDYVKCCYKPGKNDMIMWGCPEMGMPKYYGNTVEPPIYLQILWMGQRTPNHQLTNGNHPIVKLGWKNRAGFRNHPQDV